jgi:hypothetical protein
MKEKNAHGKNIKPSFKLWRQNNIKHVWTKKNTHGERITIYTRKENSNPYGYKKLIPNVNKRPWRKEMQ